MIQEGVLGLERLRAAQKKKDDRDGKLPNGVSEYHITTHPETLWEGLPQFPQIS
jgi:hypothetical protein